MLSRGHLLKYARYMYLHDDDDLDGMLAAVCGP
jgi:hypothetical protein